MGRGEFDDRPDAHLVAAAQAGNRDAFDALLRRHYDRIHGLAWHITGSRTDADDVAQEVCCKLVTALTTFRAQAQFTTWLCGIVINASRDCMRRRRSLGGMVSRLTVLAGLARQPDGRDLHDAMWLKSAIARLKPAMRETAALVVGQQLTHAEAAEILSISEATVSWRMHELRKTLGGAGQ